MNRTGALWEEILREYRKKPRGTVRERESQHKSGLGPALQIIKSTWHHKTSNISEQSSMYWFLVCGMRVLSRSDSAVPASLPGLAWFPSRQPGEDNAPPGHLCGLYTHCRAKRTLSTRSGGPALHPSVTGCVTLGQDMWLWELLSDIWADCPSPTVLFWGPNW